MSAPIDYGVLTHDQICAMCTFDDKSVKGAFSPAHEMYLLYSEECIRMRHKVDQKTVVNWWSF